DKIESNESFLVDGYAPFCKHIFISNFTPTKPVYIKISSENEHLIKTSYSARTEDELPVLSRYINATDIQEIEPAKFLDLILYSREQIIIENKAMGKETVDTTPWGIVSIKAQNVNVETPMQPITMLRNALGQEEGGSGIPLDRKEYL